MKDQEKKGSHRGIDPKLKQRIITPLKKGRLTDGAAAISIGKFIRDAMITSDNGDRVILIKPSPELEDEMELVVEPQKGFEEVIDEVIDDGEVLLADASLTPSMAHLESIDKGGLPEELPIATSVDDTMSFKAAFAAAREEIGGGGLFVWRGKPYGTYLGSEWKSLPADLKEQYTDNVRYTIDLIEQEQTPEVDATVNERPELETIAELAPRPASRIDSEYHQPMSAHQAESHVEAEVETDTDKDNVVEETAETETSETEDFIEADAVVTSDDTIYDGEPHPNYDIEPGYSIDPDLSFNNDMDMGEFISDANLEMEP